MISSSKVVAMAINHWVDRGRKGLVPQNLEWAEMKCKFSPMQILSSFHISKIRLLALHLQCRQM